jgi:hypothetical protein
MAFIINLHSPLDVNAITAGDSGIIELSTMNAAEGKQTLGFYSRYRFNHPGPLFFYMSVPLYSLIGLSGIYITAMMVNLFSIAAMLICSRKIGGRVLFYVFAFLLLLFIKFFSSFSISIWNPVFTVLPLGAYIFLSIYFSLGNSRALWGIILFGTYIVQSHLAYIPVCGAVFALAMLLFFLNKKRDALKKNFIVGAILVLMLWCLPIWQQVTAKEGNFTRLYNYFAHGKSTYTEAPQTGIATSNKKTALKASVFMFSRFIKDEKLLSLGSEYKSDIYSWGISLAVLFSLAGLFVWRKHLSAQSRFFVIFTLTAVLFSYLSLLIIQGPIFYYLAYWTTLVGVFICASVLWLFYSRYETAIRHYFAFKHSEAFLLAALIALSLYSLSEGAAYKQFRDFGKTVNITTPLEAKIGDFVKDGRTPVMISIDKIYLWPQAPPILCWLKKNGYKISLSDDWIFMFGDTFKSNGSEQKALVLTDEPALDKAIPQCNLIGENRPLYVYGMNMNTFENFSGKHPADNASDYEIKIRILRSGKTTSFIKIGSCIDLELAVGPAPPPQVTGQGVKQLSDAYITLGFAGNDNKYFMGYNDKGEITFNELARPFVRDWQPYQFSWSKIGYIQLPNNKALAGEYVLSVYLVPVGQQITAYKPVFQHKVVIEN